MPIKWTAEIDQILLLKILETSTEKHNCNAISAAWPDGLEKPTPRAISERLVKIKQMAKASGASANSGTTTPAKASSNVGTPRKRAANGNGNGVKKTSTPSKNGSKNGAIRGSAKRKRAGRMSDEDAEDDSEPGFKSDHNDSNSDDDVDESPSKKAKTNGNAKVKVEAVDDQEENGTFYENVTEIPFGGDGHMEMEEGIYA